MREGVERWKIDENGEREKKNTLAMNQIVVQMLLLLHSPPPSLTLLSGKSESLCITLVMLQLVSGFSWIKSARPANISGHHPSFFSLLLTSSSLWPSRSPTSLCCPCNLLLALLQTQEHKP